MARFTRLSMDLLSRIGGAVLVSFVEMKAILPTLASLGCAVTTLSGTDATEEKVAEALKKAPSILHFATHGYVIPASRATLSGLSSSGLVADILPASRPAADETMRAKKGLPGPPVPVYDGIPPLVVDQPLERSLLALSSAQGTFDGWKAGQLRDPARDGLLSAAEISRFDLSATYLTALSACDTAVGDPVAGQGVMGLRRGFLMAGTSHLLITFWKEDSAWAPKMLNTFYEELGRTKHPSLALSRLQANALKSPQEFGGFSKMVYIAGAFGVSTTGKLPPLQGR